MSALSLRETRKNRQLFQHQAAELAGVSLATWVRWEATNDPRAWLALGLEPQGRKTYHRSQLVALALSEQAQQRLALIRAGFRSEWVSQLICSAPIPDAMKETP